MADRQPCFFCSENLTEFICISCNRSYCPGCASTVDPTFCKECIGKDSLKITNEPLVDTEGTVKTGRHIILSGEAWMRSRDVIASMSDVELDAKLTALKEAVREAEIVLDYRRIIHSQAQNEKDGRRSTKLARLRLIKAVDSTKNKATNKKSDASTKLTNEGARDAMGSLKKMGLSKEQIANLIYKLAQGGKPAGG